MIKCEQCDKEVNDDDLWEWDEAGNINYFCSKECLDKWLLAIRAKDAFKKDMDE
jgi:hypothetical protein